MSAKDTFHNQVRDALVQESWTITHDPYYDPLGKEALEWIETTHIEKW